MNNAPGQYIQRTGSLCTASTAAADEAARTERHLPMPVVVAHGILAAIMQVLVQLTALDV
ncbi:hypothetical protein ACM01_15550 [Streptomyces viridochromogenes]|uniref:Uncharacterized protein n=1 Tax=Streptomyces viridochromogenes TaxID=1938 RepID=A0A0J7ZDZ3_STRVR|nr:hypothetical protein [Streptomyces viridochromogenes]KMS74049.1 hypothetical protein ACM01_15550 [Streptomyces viridochromogenes]KOG22083.1 hypothetical protein ADK36_14230 [Streptomyces viridochromogenes]KOG29990.1 hypothetical protein ADK35_01665 [Streptomyces viridochromogenes]